MYPGRLPLRRPSDSWFEKGMGKTTPAEERSLNHDGRYVDPSQSAPEWQIMAMGRADVAEMEARGKDCGGKRLAQATTTIRQDGMTYRPSETAMMPIDHATYIALTEADAIAHTPWAELEHVSELPALPAPGKVG